MESAFRILESICSLSTIFIRLLIACGVQFLSYRSWTPLKRLRSPLKGRDSCILQIRPIGHQLLEESTDESVIRKQKLIQTIIDQRIVLMVTLIMRYGPSLFG